MPCAWCWPWLESEELLDNDAWLRRSIKVRNPYVDPLNFIQVALLNSLRNDPAPDDVDEMNRGVLLSVNGIAAGLQKRGGERSRSRAVASS